MLNASFNGNSLQTFDGVHGILLQKIHHAGKTNKQAQSYAMAHANRSTIPYVEWPDKPITLTGQVIGSSISDYQTQLDTFHSLITAQNANLDFDYAGGSLNRRYTATCTNSDVTDGDLPYHGEFNLTFTATTPFGQDTTTTTLLTDTGRTLSSYSDVITLAGSAPFQTPLITITFSAIGSAPVSGTVVVGNSGTGQQISVTRTWSATDILAVDCTLSTYTPVTVNSLPVDFTGAFPDFFLGAGTLTYSDTFASRTFDILANYHKQYI